MATLYELKKEYQMLLEMMMDMEDGEISFDDTFEALTGEIADKFEACKIIDLELEAEEEKIGREIERLSMNKARIMRNRDRLKNRITGTLIELPDQKLDSEHFHFKMVGNGGLAPLIIDESKVIPEDYFKVVKELDKEKIRECLKHGNLEFAQLGERGKHLSIR